MQYKDKTTTHTKRGREGDNESEETRLRKGDGIPKETTRHKRGATGRGGVKEKTRLGRDKLASYHGLEMLTTLNRILYIQLDHLYTTCQLSSNSDVTKLSHKWHASFNRLLNTEMLVGTHVCCLSHNSHD